MTPSLNVNTKLAWSQWESIGRGRAGATLLNLKKQDKKESAILTQGWEHLWKVLVISASWHHQSIVWVSASKKRKIMILFANMISSSLTPCLFCTHQALLIQLNWTDVTQPDKIRILGYCFCNASLFLEEIGCFGDQDCGNIRGRIMEYYVLGFSISSKRKQKKKFKRICSLHNPKFQKSLLIPLLIC